MPYEVLVGGSCFTQADAQKLRDLIDKASPCKVQDIQGQWIYYVNLQVSSHDALEQVEELLHDVRGWGLASGGPDNAFTVYATPRYISPWSSKATSIAHVCGLRERVLRIERGRRISIQFDGQLPDGHDDAAFRDVLHDRMTELWSTEPPSLVHMFESKSPAPLVAVDIFADKEDPLRILREYNVQKGLSLDESEMQYLVDVFTKLGRPPHDVELFMFAQVNSEHCRHKVFNSAWTIDGVPQDKSLFEMIKTTHKTTPDFTVSAYSDNAAVLEGEPANVWAPDYSTGSWKLTPEVVHILTKVETHNHPTAISPFPGAATGSGGEIRDEAAVGRGSTTKAGLSGFWVSDLLIPDNHAPWETDVGRPRHYASSLDIMLEAPIGSARFNNEFGRPALAGCFRTLLTPEESQDDSDLSSVTNWRGYHKPIMIAGGLGSVRPQHALKEERYVREGAHVIVLGGPAMLIGLGGGAASSSAGGESNADLDFASVQRGNPEMERRAQMVINTCTALGEQNPIAMIHDVGAGGLSNALPELVKDAGYGGNFELRQVESMDRSMSPLEIWCNEAQERYVLLINADSMNRFTSICRRERCGFSDVGTVASKDENGAARLVLTDRESKEYPKPIDLPMDALFPPKRLLQREVASKKPSLRPFDALSSLRKAYGELSGAELFKKAVERVFTMPAVGSKSFLITIGDRSVGGLTVRDQMVGPWQTPVADVAVTATSFHIGTKQETGEAMAMGEKPTLALIDPAASARMAIAESLMNIGAADVTGDLRRVKLSANWMAAVNHSGEGAALYEAVRAAMEMCTRLRVSIPVGKDSTSMKTSWKDGDNSKSVTAPVSVVISAFSAVRDIRSTWTPQLRRVEDVGETSLMFVDLAEGRRAMGGSALAQSLGAVGDKAPDMKNFDLITDYFDALSQLHKSGVVLAYHDRSDGGLVTTVAEMMFAGRCGVDMMLDGIAKSGKPEDIIDAMFNEELGAVFQIRTEDEMNFKRCFATCGPPAGLIRKFAPGGFSYGDVLGAGQGWAKSILMHDNTRREFAAFFKRPDTFALGVCNGCQMLTRLKDLIPGAQDWPNFVDNTSQQFEARYSMVRVRVDKSKPSVFFHGMDGSEMPIVVSHGEGRAKFASPNSLQALTEAKMIPLQYVDNRGNVTEQYPYNPNGSPMGVAGVASPDGRVVAMMPHPERTIMADITSYAPPEMLEEWGEFGPWLRMFRSARRWVG
ncbi:phosphoribosylformylglycinamidin [Trichoderma longibrachiatum ATCC 18648]|uniref:Phosphoribosylformylglycinamidin n=1 Tax=Trichoderma longibrachiatum ATCC 18648 TaxID=983965 RepID=A0A2T4C0K9_TRILO|nr:phosphoribosylformylglycinamidin [Trichoderma longibrachiatum ATCC 18648]